MQRSSRRTLNVRALSSVSLLIFGAFPGTALAQQTPGPAAEEERDVVVVTAQKREENVQDVPISIAAFDAERLEDAGLKDIRDLKYIVPGLSLSTAAQTTNTRISIRGIGTSGNTAIEPSVAVFVDGVYIPRVGSLLAGLNDVSSVEVLRGPQGTLWGRNASMGALNLRTTEPGNAFGGEVSVLLGDFNRKKVEAKVDMPLSDTFATRLAVLFDDRDGYGYNDLTGRDVGENQVQSARLSAAWDITPDLRWIVRGDYQRLTGDGLPIRTVSSESVTPAAITNWRRALDPDGTAGPLVGDLPLLTETYTLTLHQESSGNLNDLQYGLASDLSWEVGDYTLKLISGWRDWTNAQYDNSSAAVPIQLNARQGSYDSESSSNELQLISPDLLDGRFNFVAGLYQYEEDFGIGDTRFISDPFCEVVVRNLRTAAQLNQCRTQGKAPSSFTNFFQNTKAQAAFWQGTFNLTDAWNVTGGIRFSKDEKSAVFDQRSFNTQDAAVTENTLLDLEQEKTTYRVGTSYKMTPDVMLYASWSTGFKSGGFDSGRNASVVGQARKFNPETTENVEAGIKSVSFDGMVTANATIFQTDVEQYQFRTFDGISFAVRNNGSIRNKGVEFDVTAEPLENLTFNLAGTYLDSKYSDFRGAPGLPGFGGSQDLTGQRVPFTSEWQSSGFARYEHALWGDYVGSARADFSYTSDQLLSSAGDNDPLTRESEHTIFGLRFELENLTSDWTLALAGQNIGNELACTTRASQPNDQLFGLRSTTTGSTVYRCVVTTPRTWSIEASKRF